MAETVILNGESPEIKYLCKKGKRLAKLISMVGDISYTTHDENWYSFMVHEIIEQMLSIKVGRKIYERLEQLCDGELTPQKVMGLSDAQIKGTGTSSKKVEYIRHLSDAATNGTLRFERLKDLPDQQVISELTAIRGIGTWTAKMFLMFVLDRPDIIPAEDYAFIQIYRWLYKTEESSPKAVKNKCKKWSPYATTASRYFYRALDMGLTKQEFHLYK